jgi:hypothetical protein
MNMVMMGIKRTPFRYRFQKSQLNLVHPKTRYSEAKMFQPSSWALLQGFDNIFACNFFYLHFVTKVTDFLKSPSKVESFDTHHVHIHAKNLWPIRPRP